MELQPLEPETETETADMRAWQEGKLRAWQEGKSAGKDCLGSPPCEALVGQSSRVAAAHRQDISTSGLCKSLYREEGAALNKEMCQQRHGISPGSPSNRPLAASCLPRNLQRTHCSSSGQERALESGHVAARGWQREALSRGGCSSLAARMVEALLRQRDSFPAQVSLRQ